MATTFGSNVTDIDLPVIDGMDLSELGDGWHWWPGWSVGTIVRRLDDTRYVAVTPFLYTHGIIVGRLNQTWFYDDRWCYHHASLAVAAAMVWDGTGEPYGWHRHPLSGRRRPDGDRDQEYVEP